MMQVIHKLDNLMNKPKQVVTRVLDSQSQFKPDTPLDDKLEIAAHMFVEQAIDAMASMSSKDAMIAAGISIEKMQLLRGLPTEIAGSIGILVKIGERAAEEGIPLQKVLNALLSSMVDQK